MAAKIYYVSISVDDDAENPSRIFMWLRRVAGASAIYTDMESTMENGCRRYTGWTTYHIALTLEEFQDMEEFLRDCGYDFRVNRVDPHVKFDSF